MAKVLVTYFSASGVTKAVAAEIAQVENADLFEIRPPVAYSREDLDWTNKQSRSTVEMTDLNCRPEMAEKIDIADYDVIFIGFPIWWGREPSIIDTFIDFADFAGKKIVPFCTSGGGGIANASKRIAELAGPDAVVDAGKRLGGDVSIEDLKIWTDGLE